MAHPSGYLRFSPGIRDRSIFANVCPALPHANACACNGKEEDERHFYISYYETDELTPIPMQPLTTKKYISQNKFTWNNVISTSLYDPIQIIHIRV